MKKLLLLIFISSALIAQTKKGTLYIIGGAMTDEMTKVMKKEFVEIAGGKNSYIIIIPNASGYPKENGEAQSLEFQKNGAITEVLYFNRETADVDSNLAKMEKAKAVFFIGGDQSRLTADLLGTKLLQKIKDVYSRGGLVGGSSAGAAVMSEVMITGNELINKDSTSYFHTIQKGNVEVKEGFGFLKTVIIDQHFIVRKRINRLLSLMFEYPNLLGIGIDESTAIIVRPDETFTVRGDTQVLIIDPANANFLHEGEGKIPAASDFKMHILNDGAKFDLKTKKAIK